MLFVLFYTPKSGLRFNHMYALFFPLPFCACSFCLKVILSNKLVCHSVNVTGFFGNF
jgi:hypothetical protein